MKCLKPVSLVAEVLEEMLRNNISRKEAVEVFLKIYVDPTFKPEWLEEALATLILVDEEPEQGAPTTTELKAILEKLKQKIRETPQKTMQNPFTHYKST